MNEHLCCRELIPTGAESESVVLSKYFLLSGCGMCPRICRVQPQSPEMCGHNFDKGEKYMMLFMCRYQI